MKDQPARYLSRHPPGFSKRRDSALLAKYIRYKQQTHEVSIIKLADRFLDNIVLLSKVSSAYLLSHGLYKDLKFGVSIVSVHR